MTGIAVLEVGGDAHDPETVLRMDSPGGFVASVVGASKHDNLPSFGPQLTPSDRNHGRQRGFAPTLLHLMVGPPSPVTPRAQFGQFS